MTKQLLITALENMTGKTDPNAFVRLVHLHARPFFGDKFSQGGFFSEIDVKKHNAAAATVLFVVQPTNGILAYTTAECKYPDNFSRKIGRAVVEGRFLKGSKITVIDGVTKPLEVTGDCIKVAYHTFTDNIASML